MTTKKIFKRIFIGLGVFILLFIGALVAIPFLFRDEIVEAVKKVANENLNAKLDFAEVDISLLRSFPSVSIGLNDYSVTGVDDFEGVKLVAGEAFNITVDFWSARERARARARVARRPLPAASPGANERSTSSASPN